MKALNLAVCLALLIAVPGSRAAGSDAELFAAAEANDAQAMERLLAAGADANATDEQGAPLLFWAIMLPTDEIITQLIAHGADINFKGGDNVTPLYLAAKFQQPEKVNLLLAHGANVNAATKSGFTPLFAAAENGHLEIARTLLDRGADVNAAARKGMTPLLIAFYAHNTKFMVESQSPTAVQMRNLMTGRELAAQRALLSQVKGEYRDVLLLLIARGADVKKATDEIYPLGIAAISGDRELAAALIEKGADVNFDDWNARESVLHAAIAEKQFEIAELLINSGADVNAKNRSRRTPLHFVAGQGGTGALAELMVQRGADVNARDSDRRTARDYAVETGNQEVVEVLDRNGARH